MSVLKRFSNGQRVRVVNPDDEHEALRGQTGTVARIRHSDPSAWVRMDNDLPADLVVFPSGDDARHRHVPLFPDECEAVQ